jgi:OOP family OmpA-OmpF porin
MTKKFAPSFAVMSLTLALTGFSSASYAATDTRDVVRASNGTIVTNSFDQCVRTDWNVGGDACGPVQVSSTTTETVAKPRHHVQIGQEQRTIYFAFNKSDLTPEARAKLDSLTEVLKSSADVKEAKIVGYADRIGTNTYNDKLSQARAENVKNYIIAHGYANASVAETRWLGKRDPVTQCSSSMKRPELINCLQADRRVEVEIGYAEQTAYNE